MHRRLRRRFVASENSLLETQTGLENKVSDFVSETSSHQ